MHVCHLYFYVFFFFSFFGGANLENKFSLIYLLHIFSKGCFFSVIFNPFYIGPYDGYFCVCLGCHNLHLHYKRLSNVPFFVSREYKQAIKQMGNSPLTFQKFVNNHDVDLIFS
jgi:hypothetical protein